MSNKKTTIGSRLREFRNVKGLSASAFAAQTGLNRTYLSDVEADRREPSRNFLDSLNKTYDLSYDWILTGSGQMFIDAPKEGVRKDVSNLHNSGLEKLDCGLFAAGDMIYLPMSSITACCGSGFDVFDNYSLDDSIAVNRRQVGTLRGDMVPFAVQTEGRSMEGFGIREGSIVIVNPAEEVCSGHVAMVIFDDKASIKKIYDTPDGKDLVSSNGQKYHVTSEELSEGWVARICGRVMLVISPPEDGV